MEILFVGWHHIKGKVEYHPALACADVAFAIGATIEVVLSYFYVFDDLAEFSIGIAAANTTAQVLWIICALIYVVYTLATRSHHLNVQKEGDEKDIKKNQVDKCYMKEDTFCDGAVSFGFSYK